MKAWPSRAVRISERRGLLRVRREAGRRIGAVPTLTSPAPASRPDRQPRARSATLTHIAKVLETTPNELLGFATGEAKRAGRPESAAARLRQQAFQVQICPPHHDFPLLLVAA